MRSVVQPETVTAAVEAHLLLEPETNGGVLLCRTFQIVSGRIVDEVATFFE
jgi:hypothetical protein